MEASWATLLSLFLAVVTGTSSTDDLLAVVDAEDYFNSRNISLQAKDLIPLAGKNPKDAKESVAQLLAIRYLGEKKEKTARDTIQQVADGKAGQDKHGFAKQYAVAALARIDGKQPPADGVPKDSLRVQGLEWFPDDVNLFGGFDLRGTLEPKPVEEEVLRARINKAMPGPMRKEIYDFLDGVGNVRLERVSFAYRPDPGRENGGRIFARATGRYDRAQFVKYMKEHIPHPDNMQIEERKGDITILTDKDDKDFGIALIGDTDFVIVGDTNNTKMGAQGLEEVLEIRSTGKRTLVKGPFAGALKESPANASFLLMGQLPNELRTLGAQPAGTPLPVSIAIDVTIGKGIDFRYRGTMENEADAKKFASAVADWKKQGIAILPMLAANKLKPDQIKLLNQTIESVKMQADGATVGGGVQIPAEVVKILWELFEKELPNF